MSSSAKNSALQNGLPASARNRKKTKDAGDKTEDTSEYKEGSIVRIKLENFVTYDSVEFRPGPHLNVIIGPNGTGKSSIVCAICLGLAGKASILNRQDKPTGFIKYGCNKAVIELELFNPDGENTVIRREITKTGHSGGTSNWMVNNRPASQKVVEDKVRLLNIQVGNLCQFLPQEKVADFAKMSQQELLENTEKAAGPEGMFEIHQQLKSARQDARRLERDFEDTNAHLQEEQQKNARLEQEVKNFEERERHLERVKILKMKRPWLEYEEKRVLYVQEKARREELEKQVKEARSVHAPLKAKLDRAQKKVKDTEAQMREKGNEVKEHAKKAAGRSKDIENLSDKMAEIEDELKNKQETESKRQRKLNELKRQMKGFQNELSNLEEEGEDVQPAIDKINQETRKTNHEISSCHQRSDVLKSELRDLENQKRGLDRALSQIQDVNQQRLDMLYQRHRDTHDAVLWLRENKQRFKATIHEPMLLTLNVKDKKHAKYIESHISINDLRAFVCEDSSDMNLFMKILRDEQRKKINAVCAPREPPSHFKPKNPIQHYKKHGFHSYLKEMFDCPAPVMSYLCLQYRVHMIPVGTEHTRQVVENVERDFPELSQFYTANHSFSVKRSKYSHEISTRSSELREPRMLTVTMDVQRERELGHQIQQLMQTKENKKQEYDEISAQIKGLDKKMEELRNEKKELTTKRDRKRTLQTQIRNKEDSIRRVESEAVDITVEEERAKRGIRDINNKKIAYLDQLKMYTENCLVYSMEKVKLSLQYFQAQRESSMIESEIRERQSSLTQLEREYAEFKERLKNIKDLASSLLTAAKKATGTAANESLSPEMQSAFDSCPSTLDEIDAAMHEEQARADCTFAVDESVIHDFKARKQRIARLQHEVLKKEEQLENHQTKVEEMKQSWMGPLEELVDKINRNFSYFFKEMKCAGEVDILKPDNLEDYEKYGIRIKVKFRDHEPMCELTSSRQSGGERSVATVLYLMSLQELARCPFRIVDEINQGMDPVNERKVFELVVQTMTRPNTGQYFLLTPKLLADLEYSDNMNVLCVYNGPKMLNHTEWNIRKFLKRRARCE